MGTNDPDLRKQWIPGESEGLERHSGSCFIVRTVQKTTNFTEHEISKKYLTISVLFVIDCCSNVTYVVTW